MTDKIKAILIKLAKQLQSKGWRMGPDYDISFLSEESLSLIKNVAVKSSFGDDKWEDTVEISMDLKLGSDDQITWYPEIQLIGQIAITGANYYKDIDHNIPDTPTGFSEADINNDGKIALSAREIDNAVEEFVQEEFDEYMGQNATALQNYRKGGWKADDDAYRDR